MARQSDLIKRRNADILKEYDRLRRIKVGRARKHTTEYIIAKLGEMFYLSERRVEDIVWKAR